jgi:hypothetical protein
LTQRSVSGSKESIVHEKEPEETAGTGLFVQRCVLSLQTTA